MGDSDVSNLTSEMNLRLLRNGKNKEERCQKRRDPVG